LPAVLKALANEFQYRKRLSVVDDDIGTQKKSRSGSSQIAMDERFPKSVPSCRPAGINRLTFVGSIVGRKIVHIVSDERRDVWTI